MKYNFTNNQITYIIHEYLNNKKSVENIAKALNCSNTPITRVLKENNIKIENKRRNPILSQNQIEKLIKDYQIYQNLQVIAKKYHQTTTKISQILKAHNIEVVNPYVIPKIKKEFWPNIAKTYQNGKSVIQISKQYNVSPHAIARILRRQKVKIVNWQNFPRMDESVFEKIDNEEKAYWLGFIYADGYISKGEFGIGLSIKDESHLLKFKQFINYTGNLRYRQDTNSCILAFRNKKIISDLKKLGVLERKSKTSKFPNIEQVPQKYLRHFIRGFIDGNGSIFYNQNGLARLSIVGTFSMLDGIISTLNFKRNKISKANKFGCNEVNQISWLGEYVLDYLKLLYNDSTISLDRKHAKINEIIKVRETYLKTSQIRKNATVKYLKPVNQLDDSGKIIKKWTHLQDASNMLNIRPSYIMRVCNKVRKHTGGFRWEYFTN